jgi:integral membrane protein (TIGR00529 family)
LTTALAEIDLWHLVFFTLPLTLVALAVGYLPLKGCMENQIPKGADKALGPFLIEVAPILFVIVCGLLLGYVLEMLLPPAGRSIEKELGLIAALLAAIGWVWQKNRMPAAQCWAIIRQPALLKMVYMVAGILIFKGILEDSGAVNQVSQEMLRWHVPLLPIAMFMPFLVGAVAGITIAFVGATFPILISLIQAMDQVHLLLPYLMLALLSGFAGVLLSPLHLCLLLSNEYFKTSLLPMYRHMCWPLAALWTAGLGYFGLLRCFMG